jgi:hypothetical protein
MAQADTASGVSISYLGQTMIPLHSPSSAILNPS